MYPADAELVAGLRAGDQQAFAEVYDRYADRLFDFCLAMLRDRDDAADAVQDTMLAAVRRIGQLREPERLRAWLYAIARTTALDRMRARRRTVPVAEPPERPDEGAGPERAAEQETLRALVADAASGLSERERTLLHLHLRHGLVGGELAVAVGVTPATVNVRLSRLRDQVERSLGALLVARLGRADCAELAGLLGAWDGRFSPLIRKRVARHVDGCAVCERRRRAAASPWALLAGLAMVPAPLALRDRVLGSVDLVAYASPTGPAGRGRTRAVAGGLVAAALGGGVVVLSRAGSGPVPVAAAGAAPTSVTESPPPTALPTDAAPQDVGPAAPGSAVLPPADLPPSRDEPAVADPPTDPPPDPLDPTPDPPVEPPGEPVVTGQDVSPGRVPTGGCRGDSARVTVTVQPGGPGTTVDLRWRDATGTAGETALAGSGTAWTGTLGPFAAPGVVVWSLTVTDAAGTTKGPDGTLEVYRCAAPPSAPGSLRGG